MRKYHQEVREHQIMIHLWVDLLVMRGFLRRFKVYQNINSVSTPDMKINWNHIGQNFNWWRRLLIIHLIKRILSLKLMEILHRLISSTLRVIKRLQMYLRCSSLTIKILMAEAFQRGQEVPKGPITIIWRSFQDIIQ